ncbi:MAG: glycosyltransferase [Actinomycetota bacterium]|nr:glycosyltransferase [Actinomycetota bacterium]
MPVSIITTLKNEESSIGAFLDSLLSQSRPPDEIVVVDGGSTDGTVNIIGKFIQKGAPIRLMETADNRSVGRNLAIRNARHEIIASTDAGSVADKDWLKNIVEPFEKDPTIDVVSGVTLPRTESFFEDCVAVINLPEAEDINPETFLPSSRSAAFRKNAWEKARGYPEQFSLNEDTVFNFALKGAGCKFFFAPDAVVYWRPPSTFKKVFRQFYAYARGDGQAGLYLWEYYFPKRCLIYSLGVALLVAGYFYPPAWVLLLPGLLIYLSKPCSKAFGRLRKLGVFPLLPAIIFTRDLAELFGYLVGLGERAINPSRFRSG